MRLEFHHEEVGASSTRVVVTVVSDGRPRITRLAIRKPLRMRHTGHVIEDLMGL